MTPTDAEKVAKKLGNDGKCFKDAQGNTLRELAEDAGAARARGGGWETYDFPDGSVITICGGGWDIGYPGCFCWAGAGHVEGCAGE